MSEPIMPSLSPEEMACLIDGLGTQKQLAEWHSRLIANPFLFREFKHLEQLASTPPGIVADFVVEGYLSQYFPKAEFQGLCLSLKNKAIKLIDAAGWMDVSTVFRDGELLDTSIFLSRKFDSLNVDFQLERVGEQFVNITLQVKDIYKPGSPTMKVALRRNGSLVGSQYLSSNTVQFREIMPGEYSIHLGGSAGDILKVDIKLEP
jgi:hypothetical protein